MPFFQAFEIDSNIVWQIMYVKNYYAEIYGPAFSIVHF